MTHLRVAVSELAGKYQQELPANSAIGVPDRGLCRWAREDAIPRPYRLRLSACNAGSAAPEAIGVQHIFTIDDGLADGVCREVILTTDLNTVDVSHAYAIIEGVGLDVRVRCRSVPTSAPVVARNMVVTATIAELA